MIFVDRISDGSGEVTARLTPLIGGLVVCLLTLVPLSNVRGQVPLESTGDSKIFLIGNSLTWDTLPGLLEGDVQWHVDCGKSLKFIHDHPGNPCVKTSVNWSEALTSKKYDFLCVQPHFGTTLAEDVAVISHWLELQPQATLVLHTGWNRAADFESHYHRTAASSGASSSEALRSQVMIHSPRYFAALQAELAAKYPQRDIRTTAAIQVLDDIWHDIEKSNAPFKSFAELYRDEIHMTTQVGRYLMHNLMRSALGQSRSQQGFQIDPVHQHYLDHKLDKAQNWQRPTQNQPQGL